MVYYDYTYIYVALHGDIRVRHKRKVTIQNPISIPLALHLDVASRHMKFQKAAHSCKRDSRFSSLSHGSEWLQIKNRTGEKKICIWKSIRDGWQLIWKTQT